MSCHTKRALWEGEQPPGDTHQLTQLEADGNEALPPMWRQYKTSSDGATGYQDDTLMFSSWNRPSNIDYPGDLAVPGCEWHISPLGRSYFVNHNTRTTSWKKLKPERPAGSLMPECVMKGHSECIWSLAYLGTSGNIMSTSGDSSIRQWKRDGEPVGKPLNNNGRAIPSMVVSPGEMTVICRSVDGRLRLWNITLKRWQHDRRPMGEAQRCLDWSRNSLEIASGSQDGTIRRWNPLVDKQHHP